MKDELMEILEKAKENAGNIEEWIMRGQLEVSDVAANVTAMATMIEVTEKIIPSVLFQEYSEFFEALSFFCKQCENIDFFEQNREQLYSSIELFVECIEDLKSEYTRRVRTCPCCGEKVIYEPRSNYYRTVQEYTCPSCRAGDEDRLIISFLKKAGLPEACEGMKLLHIAPSDCLSAWIRAHCPHIAYMPLQSDIKDMSMVSEDTYDVIIYSYALECAQDNETTLSELWRILNPDGKIVFWVTADLRFPEQKLFYVRELRESYFGEEVLGQCESEDASTLYILTKSERVTLDLSESIEIDKDLCNNGPLVSVIFPCYNHERHVAKAIESVINQSYKNIEILAGDDGSTDSSPAIMKRYAAHFAKELYAEKNTDCRIHEEMYRMATGKYIAMAHSDDVWERDKLALQVAYMESHPECGACFTWCKCRDMDGNELDDLVFIQPNRSSYEWMRFFLENGNALCHPSVLIRREIHDKRKRHAGRQMGDFFKWIEIVQMTSIHIIPKVLVYMGRHPQCTSANTEENRIRTIIEGNCGWFTAIRNMDEDFFRKAFAPYMRNPEANTREAIQCEKFFLMLSISEPLMRYNALCYYYEIYDDVKDCMEEEYHYVISDLAQDELNLGRDDFLIHKRL